jgi:phosphoribosyl-AMP cyclohydrolase
MQENLFEIIKFDEKGLIPAIAQDYQTGEILMMAWMNKTALELTIKTNFAHYFSRSRNQLWKKGETSKQTQEVQEILLDCDGDCLVLKVKQNGVACHTGTKSCFFRTVVDSNQLKINQKALISTKELYGQNV